MKVTTNTIRLAATAVVGMILGCNQQGPTGVFFRAEEETSPVFKVADAQAACGARQDAALYPQHFDGGNLNSLGEAKLDTMLHDDDSPTPVTIYVAAGANDSVTDARWKAVTAFLKDKGLKDSQIKIADGSNPASRGSAAKNLSEIHKTDTGSVAGAGGAGATGTPMT